MIRFHRAARAACLLIAAANGAHAQQAPQASAADPRAPVPATTYRPLLSYQAPAAPGATPDRNWVAANETVAAINSMMLTMKPRAAPPQHDHGSMHGMHAHETGAAGASSAKTRDKETP